MLGMLRQALFDLDKWQEIAETLGKNKLRTFLTAFGVFWGILMLVVMLGVGQGFEKGVSNTMGGSAFNAVFVWGGRTTVPYKGMRPGRWVRFNNSDIEAVAGVEGVENLAPRMQLGGWRDGVNVSHANETGNFSIMGDMPAIQHVQPIRLIEGRFLNALDIRDKRKVAVIGKGPHDILFGGRGNPVGKYIKIQGIYFQVVGVFHPYRSGEWGQRDQQTIFVPFSTFQQAFNWRDKIGWFAMTAKPGYDSTDVETRVKQVLAERHRISPVDHHAPGSNNAAKEYKKIESLFTGIHFLIWFVGILTLLAGVLGVSNIMLIAVKERTKEIGVRKALGAKPRSIVAMIVTESVVLTSIAGYVGLVAGVGALEVVGHFFASDTGKLAWPTIDVGVALLATVVLIVCGAIAGIIPAHHAASIKPVEALRAE